MESDRESDEFAALLPKGDWAAALAAGDGRSAFGPHRRWPVALTTLAAVGVAGCLALARAAGGDMDRTGAGPALTELAEEEDHDPCDKYPYLKYEVPDAVVYNNLGNKGPDYYNGEGMIYRTLDLGQGAGDELDREVYMTVNATNPDYNPFSPRLNGVQGKYGSINLNAGSHVDLLFSFYDRETMQKLTLPEFALTFFDLDTGSGGASAEYLIAGGFKSYHVKKHTEVQVEPQPDGRTRFGASTVGTGEDNPKDPNFLTEQQENRAVTLLFGPTESLSVTVGAMPGNGPRFFTFVGRPSLLCATTVQENYRPPLPDLTFTPPMQDGIYVSRGEKFVSFSVRKGDKVRAGDVIATTKKKNGAQRDYLAEHDGKVTQLQDKLKNGEKCDERLSEKLIAVIDRPELERLPLDEGDVPGGPGKDSGLPVEAIFDRWLVDVGDEVQKGGGLAVALDRKGGQEVRVNATDYGVVKKRQEKIKAGSLLKSVPDAQLVTLGPIPPLETPDNDTQPAAPLPPGEGLTFLKYSVAVGDIVKEGDEIAKVKDANGQVQVVKASRGGVIAELMSMEEGMPMDRLAEPKNLATTGKFPALEVAPGCAGVGLAGASPPVDDGEARAPPIGEAPLDEFSAEGLRFVRYHVSPGDVVETGDALAEVEDAQGVRHNISAPRPGVVRQTQSGLKGGMVLDKVMRDGTLATLGRLPALNVDKGEEGEFAPQFENWRLKEWRVEEGDQVKKGEPIAVLEKRSTGETKEVPASRSGLVTQRLPHLKPGDEVEEASADSDLATIGPLNGPKLEWREVGGNVPDRRCVFEGWDVAEGEDVKMGDPVATLKCPARRLVEGRRRLSEAMEEWKLPAPANGYISYLAKLKPGESIRDAKASATIVKVNKGWPHWFRYLLLIPLLCMLCCCLGFLYAKKRKADAEREEPPQKPQTYKPMAPVLKAVVPVMTPGREAGGIRLDFEGEGKRHTVHAKYRPLGIRHNHTAPIIAHDFTCNSYARQMLGVRKDWKLVQIGGERLHDGLDFDEVNGKLNDHMREFPVWPLPLEFRKHPDDKRTHVYEFIERPLGLEFTNVAPIRVDRVYADSPADRHNIEVGWTLCKVGDFEVGQAASFREVLKYFTEGVQGLDDGKQAYPQDEGGEAG